MSRSCITCSPSVLSGLKQQQSFAVFHGFCGQGFGNSLAGQFWLGSRCNGSCTAPGAGAARGPCSSGPPAAPPSAVSGLSIRSLPGAGLGFLAASDVLDAGQSSKDTCPERQPARNCHLFQPYFGSHTASIVLWHSLS